MKKKTTSAQRRGSYEVGKGRPPTATRWKPGQSGNPKGRPRGAKNLVTLFHEALQQKLQIEEHGKSRTITAREGIVRRLVNLALKGDIKATAFVLAKEAEITQQVRLVEETIPRDPVEAAKTYARLMKTVQG
jgi:hypothetical protein